jgi:calcineurin-like phosphoesterase family protein
MKEQNKMNVWFTSDTHFKHKNILKFCPNTRRGADPDEMTEIMIQVWNEKIKPGDIVYHLGDVCFARQEETNAILARLNGDLHLIQGHHDKVVVNGGAEKFWKSIQPYLRAKVNGQDIIMFHYPIKEWDSMHYGSWHLYGHVHGKDMGLNDRRAMDAGIDNRPTADMSPWHFDEIAAVMLERPVFSHHN